VKRKNARRALFSFLILIFALSTSSCSLMSRRQDVSHASSNQTVPKEQYDELARKYQELLAQSKNQNLNSQATKPVETEVATTVASATTAEKQLKPQVPTTTSIDPSELVNSIDKAIPDVAKIDSVDALNPETKQDKKDGPPVPTSMGVQSVNNTDDVDDQIIRLREVQELIKVNKFENALTILKELENSKERQIVVRAKMMLGDLLFNQGEFDLASQVYEEIIKKYAFSGYVLKSLGKLVACSEKLKQPEKQAKYYSLLHDFFEAG
jgi:tetratricopeptide (TPR) repeat protein